jgi:carbonic anhydrase/acetyltransferase-like protein (isoleucine patch superfamily)
MLKTVQNLSPVLDEQVFVAENAIIIGDVRILEGSSIWFHAVIRGDVNGITIGKACNIQDGAILHCTYKKTALNIGDKVSIGHGAIVHGCTIEDEVLIGMRATIMDGVIIPSRCLIAAGALITENQVLEPSTIYAGVPAKPLRKLDPDKHLLEIERIARNYQQYASWYQDQ